MDLGWRNRKISIICNDDNAIKLAALYQWVWNIDGGFNWYAGVGGGLGSMVIKITVDYNVNLHFS
jgi:hypothetical protein